MRDLSQVSVCTACPKPPFLLKTFSQTIHVRGLSTAVLVTLPLLTTGQRQTLDPQGTHQILSSWIQSWNCETTSQFPHKTGTITYLWASWIKIENICSFSSLPSTIWTLKSEVFTLTELQLPGCGCPIQCLPFLLNMIHRVGVGWKIGIV